MDTPSEGDVGECPDAELEDELHGVAHEDFIFDGRYCGSHYDCQNERRQDVRDLVEEGIGDWGGLIIDQYVVPSMI